MNSQPPTLTPILRSFVIEQTGESEWRAPSVPNDRRPILFGGQLVGQLILAASAAQPQKRVKSLQMIFTRTGSVAHPVDLKVATLHDGRALGALSVAAWQGERLLAPGLALMDVGEADVIRHQPAMPNVADAEDLAPARMMIEEGTEIRIVDDVDLRTSAVTGPPELSVWVRFAANGNNQAVHQALLAWWTDPFLIGTAMRPHDGIGQEQAHETISTGVLTHSIAFHEEVAADQWHLIANQSLHAGHGRTYGTGNVFSRDRRLVASFAQENMIRQFRAGDMRRGTAAGAL
jgi:acyl-CoA thioesterase